MNFSLRTREFGRYCLHVRTASAVRRARYCGGAQTNGLACEHTNTLMYECLRINVG